jgi:hypothetical protein
MHNDQMKPLFFTAKDQKPKSVLYVNMDAGHKAISEAADDHFTIIRNIAEVLSLSESSDLSPVDMPNLFGSLCALLDQMQGLHNAAYDAALMEVKPVTPEEKRSDQDDTTS